MCLKYNFKIINCLILMKKEIKLKKKTQIPIKLMKFENNFIDIFIFQICKLK